MTPALRIGMARAGIRLGLQAIADDNSPVEMVTDGQTTEFWVTLDGQDYYLTMRRAATRPLARILKRGRR